MSFFEWKDTMTVGNPMIDRDHKMLIQYINEMHAAMMAGKGKEVVGPIVGKLVAYTKDHFSREEVVWKSGHYVGLDRHQKEHVELIKNVVDFKTKYDQGAMALSVDVMNFLRDWLKTHILKSDKAAFDAISLAAAKAKAPVGAHAMH